MSFAMVFPGQGSQAVGMMAPYGDLAVVRNTFFEASDVLGEDLWQMVVDGPSERLALTINTQPLMLTAGVAVWRAWLEKGGPLPAVVAGHSLGEYSALVAADALEFSEAVALVRFRAQAMQEAVPAGTGAMAAVMGLDASAVAELCVEAAQGEVLSPANLNEPRQIVIAGTVAAVARAAELAKARGAKRALLLPVSAPFHCALMKPAAERLRARLADVMIRTPKISVLNNVDVAVCQDPELIREALVRQAYSPVRWIESVEHIASLGITQIFECGPGKVLAGLCKRITDAVPASALIDADSVAAALAAAQQISEG